MPTVSLERQVSVFTPEIYSAFPRRFGPGALTVADAIGTGFYGTYSYRRLTLEQATKRAKLISELAPGETEDQKLRWSERLFAELPPSEQSLALLMRTLVHGAPLLILDEAFGGMDDRMIRLASDYLRNNLSSDQAVIFVSHWEHEVPWSNVKTYMIENGIGRVV
jgi:ABC-type molybdenum transport system ATPase subunit/photorepair protein PhrA